jgi:hypothetical protein
MSTEKINIHSDQIYSIDNFISDDTTSLLLSYVNLDGDEGWQSRGVGTSESVDQLTELFFEEGDKIENKILSLFSNGEHMHLNSMRKIRRLTSGEFIHGHKDLGPEGQNSEIRFGVILYLNDDFEGGEVYYKDLNLKIKPKKNSLIVHRSTFFHEVLPVTSGIRYSMTTFIWGDETTNFVAK